MLKEMCWPGAAVIPVFLRQLFSLEPILSSRQILGFVLPSNPVYW